MLLIGVVLGDATKLPAAAKQVIQRNTRRPNDRTPGGRVTDSWVPTTVMPAKAGIHDFFFAATKESWILAFAGMRGVSVARVG